MRCGRSTIARVAVLLLALYIVVDFGTPLLPGAFRFEMSQSIEAGGRPGVRLAGSVAHDALAPNPVPAVRAELNAFRRRIVRRVLTDGPLLGLAGPNGFVRYAGCATTLAAGRSMEGEMSLSFAVRYVLRPVEMED